MVQVQSQKLTNWHKEKKHKIEDSRHGYYILWKGYFNLTLANTPKKYTLQYYQLKIRNGAVESYLAKIKVVETPKYWWCDKTEQTVEYLYIKC